MSGPVASVEVDFIAQTAAFNANVTKAAENLNSNAAKMHRSIQSIEAGFKTLGKVTAAVVGLNILKEVAGDLFEVTKRGLEYAASLGETAQQLGVNAQALQVYRFAGGQVGIQQEQIDKGLQKLTKTLGEASVGAKEPLAAFKALGIGIRDAQGNVKTADQVIPEIAKKFDTVGSAAQRAAVETTLFGKAGQQWDTLLAGGSGQLEELTNRLKDLGVVLSDREIQTADSAADKIEEVKTVLEQSIAKAVADNAASIYDFANSLENLLAKIPSALANLELLYQKFRAWNANVNIGMIAQGMPEWATGRSAQDWVKTSQDASGQVALLNTKKAYHDFYDKLSAGDKKQFDSTVKKMWPEDLQKAMGFWQPPIVKPPPQTGTLSNFKASPSNGADKAKRDLEDFQQQQAQLNTQLLQARKANLYNVDDQLAIDKQISASEEDTLEASLRKKAATNKVVAAHLGELISVAKAIEVQKVLTLDRQAEEQKAREALDLATAANDNTKDLLQAQEAVARTSAERRAIELKLLDLDLQNEKLKLQEIIDSKTASDAAKKLAKQRLDALGDLADARREGVMKSTGGPMDQWINGLPQTSGEVLERQQQVIVDAARALSDRQHQFADDFAAGISHGVQDLLDGKSVLESMRDIVGDLAHAFQKAFITDPLTDLVRNKVSGPLSEKLFGAPAGPNGLWQKEANQALSAAQTSGVRSLLTFNTAVDAAAAALARLSTFSVGMEGSSGLSGLSALLGSSSLFSSGAGAEFASGLLSVQSATGFNPLSVMDFGLSGLGFAGGGNPPVGLASLVGEEGPEWFVPKVPGTILPAGITSNLARFAANNNGRSSGDNYHINVSGAMNERDARRTGTQIAVAIREEQARATQQGY